MNLLNEYKRMSTDDKVEFIHLLKEDLTNFSNKYKYDDLIKKLNEKEIDLNLFFIIIDKPDELIKIANVMKELIE